MNAKIRIWITLAAVALTLAGLPFEQSAAGQSANGNCLKVKGKTAGVFNGVTFDLVVTQAGILNGTGEVTFDFVSGIFPTPDPNSFTYRGELTFNAQQGQLKLRYVALDQVGPPFIHTDIAHVDPDASTGIFAAATGVMYTRGDDTNAEFTGEICLANN